MLVGVDEIRASLASLRAAGFRFTFEAQAVAPAFPAGRRRGPMARLVERMYSRLQRQDCEGVADLAGRRSMRDYRDYAVLRLGDQEWGGRSGRALSTLPVEAPGDYQPLWLVEALAGAVAVRTAPAGFVVTADLAAVDFWNAPWTPAAENVELEVVLDPAAELRSIRWTDGTTEQWLTVLEIGVDADALDWTRLPTFRTPQD